MDQLSSLQIRSLRCEQVVANEFLDLLTCYDHGEQSLEKLILFNFQIYDQEPFDEEVLTRLANKFPRL